MAKSVSDSDPDSKPVSSLFWRSVLNADEPRSSSSSSSSSAGGFRAGARDHHVKSDDGSSNKPQWEEDEATRFAKRPRGTMATSVKQEEYPYPETAGDSYDVRYGRPQPQEQQQQDLPPRHHPQLLPTGPATGMPCATPSAAAAASRRPIQQYPAEIWETHKAHLHHLYIQQGKSLKQIQQIMAQRGFNARLAEQSSILRIYCHTATATRLSKGRLTLAQATRCTRTASQNGGFARIGVH